MSISSSNEMKAFVIHAAQYFAAVFLLFGLLNGVCLFRQAERYGTMGPERNDNAYIKDAPDGIQICNFGSSHGCYGFNYEDVSSRVCFNFALPSQTVSYDYRILQNYRSHMAGDAVVFLTLSYFSLWGAPDEENPEFLSRNNRYYLFLDDAYIQRYDRTTDLYVNYLPALTFSTPVALAKNLLGLDNRNAWNAETNREEAESHAYLRYLRHVQSRLNGAGERVTNEESVEALKDLIAFCKNNRMTPILVTTPYLSEYPDTVQKYDEGFFDDFYGLIRGIAGQFDVAYYDYSRDSRFSRSYELFVNTDHLNREGARQFTNILMDEIVSQIRPEGFRGE